MFTLLTLYRESEANRI